MILSAILSMKGQGAVFLISVGAGGAIGLLYDFFRAGRKLKKPPAALIHAQDALFWLISAFIMYYSALRGNHGEIRFFLIAGAFLGMLLYFNTASRFVVKLLTAAAAPFRFFFAAALKFIENLLKKLGGWVKIKKVKLKKFLRKRLLKNTRVGPGLGERIMKKRLFWASMLFFVGVIAVAGLFYTQKANGYLEEEAKFRRQLDEAEAESRKLALEQEYKDSDEYIERIARERLGYVKPDEIVFYNINTD
ncbi:MAG: cell division protein FtsL [Clostridiales bacterium]|jgi:spore cortex biosynthesis protein YabQ|nr:cell division protein FtsL [Clostridiales bacterium]